MKTGVRKQKLYNPESLEDLIMPGFPAFSEELWVQDFEDRDLVLFQTQLENMIHAKPTDHIKIYVSSYGGSVDNALGMLDLLDFYKHSLAEGLKILTVAVGKAISAGALVLSHGDIRFATPNTRIMVHSVQGQAGGPWGSSITDIQADVKEMTRMNDQVLTILSKNCRMAKKELEKRIQRDLFLTPQEALNFGIIDHIGHPVFDKMTLSQVKVLNQEEEREQDRRTNKTPTTEKREDRAISEAGGEHSKVRRKRPRP